MYGQNSCIRPLDGLLLCLVLILGTNSKYYSDILCLRDRLGASPSAGSTGKVALKEGVEGILRLCSANMSKRIIPKRKYFYPFINRVQRTII